MVWLMLALLLHCVVCWLAASFAVHAPHAGGQEDVRRSLARARMALILMAPLLMPFVVYRVLPCLVRSS
jgi:hypothetical protein